MQKVLLPLEIALSACRRVCQIALACICKQTYRLPIFIVGAPLRVGAVLTSKTVKDFMLQKLNSLDIKGNASKDPAYARQTCEAMLSAVYSNNKDQCCKLLISKGVSITPFLKEIGEAAQNAGLPGEIKNGVFTPGGAGANPFVVPLIAAASIEYPHMFINHNQQVSFKAYAEKIVMKEVTPLFNKGKMPTPQQFQLTIENIANKYLQNAS